MLTWCWFLLLSILTTVSSIQIISSSPHSSTVVPEGKLITNNLFHSQLVTTALIISWFMHTFYWKLSTEVIIIRPLILPSSNPKTVLGNGIWSHPASWATTSNIVSISVWKFERNYLKEFCLILPKMIMSDFSWLLSDLTLSHPVLSIFKQISLSTVGVTQ